ncbi:phage baseplate assembly protein V [Roseobacteraceae bacterium S113]
MSELFRTLETTVRDQQTKYYGRYRGSVVNNEDPEVMGRVTLTVPSVLGETESVWALPVVPYGGGPNAGWLMVPPVGANVLVEFLEGDPSAPIWSGGFWNPGDEVPEEHTGPALKVLRTQAGHALVFDDTEDTEAITLTSKAGAEAKLDETGTFRLTDSEGATVVLDAEAGELRIADSHGNEMVMTSSGITCSDVNGNEITTSGSAIDITSASQINIKGSGITLGGPMEQPLVTKSFLALFNAHTHPTGVGPSGPPLPQPPTPLPTTTSTTKAS